MMTREPNAPPAQTAQKARGQRIVKKASIVDSQISHFGFSAMAMRVSK
jgi:hypothetical protein